MWQKITASVLVLSFAVGAGLFVSRSAGTRLPNGSLTGNISSSVATLLAEARALQGTQPDEAVKRYIDVLKVDPDNVEALTYRGWILRILGDSNQLPAFVEEGRASLDRAIAVDPTYPDARVFRGILAYRNDNDAKAAIAQFDAFFALEQPPAQFVQMVLGVDTEARASLGLPAREASPASATASTTAP
jgi:tetratricopeptide (TPR) repeat protein